MEGDAHYPNKENAQEKRARRKQEEGGEDKKGWGWPRKGEEVHSVSWKNEVLFAVLLSASVIKLSSSFTQSDQLIKEAESSLQSKFCVVK